MQILSASAMHNTDLRSAMMGVSVWELMQAAGLRVAHFCASQHGLGGLVLVLAGKGNNGGDGMIAAVKLAEAGVKVRMALLGKDDALKYEPLSAYHRARVLRTAEGAAAIDVREIEDGAALRAAFDGATLIVDAVTGTGFKGVLRGLAADARDLVNASTMPVVAVDLPTGWDADSTEMQVAGAMRADAVVTFVAPKPAHVFGGLTGRAFGPVVVAEIGTPQAALLKDGKLRWCGAAKSITETPRPLNTNKGRYGHVFVVGGSLGKAGAAAMASLAALRAGAGLVTAVVEETLIPTVARVAPEMMQRVLDLHAEDFAALTQGATVVAVGPGFGTLDGRDAFLRRLVDQVALPMVIDADGLNAFVQHTELLREIASRGRTLVLTPHPGEMARLLGTTVAAVEADRIEIARHFATRMGVTLVLKGWRTLVAHPDGSVAVNTTGNAAMAKAGSGDILTGIVAALLAQHPQDVARAVEAAVYLHGLAGDFASLAQEEHTVLATDTVAHLGDAFRARNTDADGLTWLCGLAAESRKVANG